MTVVARAIAVAAVVAAAGALAGCGADRQDAVVAAASDTRDAFAEIADVVRREDGLEVGFVFGSSGLLREQLLNGGPYDAYVSANTAYVDEVVEAGVGVAATRREYAVGRLAIIAAPDAPPPTDPASLVGARRIVIANPEHAPYGVAARDALHSLGIDAALAARTILADNVADAVRIVDAGEADAGIVALSLVGDRPHLVVDASLHEPIRQTMVVTRRGEDNAAVRAFVRVLASDEGLAILARHGFEPVAP